MNWTDRQREALETRGRKVIVSAGAGSGKTRVLVERFLLLLEENPTWKVSDIVAVTFTEKAAREMVSRIRREIRSRIELSTSDEDRRRWRERRNALDSARIGTIHSLCSSILRAHPAEAALDPAFEVIEEVEATALLEQSIEEAITESARGAQFGASSEIELFTHLTSREVQYALRSLVAQGDRARSALSLIEVLSSEEIIEFQRDRLDQARLKAATSLIERDSWNRNAGVILRLCALDPTDLREQCRAAVAELLAKLDDKNGEAIIDTLLEIASAINLRGGSKKKWASENDFQSVKEALANLREAVRNEKLFTLEMNDSDSVAAQVIFSLTRLCARARNRFAHLKQQQAALDFNDLEEMTDRLLAGHPEICERYNNAENGLIRSLMIDEFQDTAPIQKRILWAIAPRSSELFIIGDAKQSIYRFRGADMTVFHDARREFISSEGREVGMSDCFRSHHRLVDFVNHLFPSVFTEETIYDTPYESMSATRSPLHENAAVEIHLLVQDKESDGRMTMEELRQAEARMIARRIGEMIADDTVLICDNDSITRRVEPGDIALLFQASTNFDIYEEALAEAGIPYVTIAGRGFYDRQEITDLSNLLAFLASPTDNLRLAAVLRSPMFSLSDETLLSLRLSERPLWDTLADESIYIPEGQSEAVAFARATIKKLRGQAGRMNSGELIIRALNETGYLATLMALPHGERRVANIEKFIEQAHTLPTMTLSEFVERIDDLKIREAREGEAAIEEAGAMRLMTVHKSKGLEFPVVWIVDATYGGGRDRDIVAIHADHGIAINVKAEGSPVEDEPPSPAFFEMIKRIEEQMDEAEKKRLLYVAATRARDHLIISGATGKSKLLGNHWLGRIASTLGLEEDDARNEIDYQSGSIAVFRHDAESLVQSFSVIASQPAKPAHFHSKTESGSVGNVFPLIGPITR